MAVLPSFSLSSFYAYLFPATVQERAQKDTPLNSVWSADTAELSRESLLEELNQRNSPLLRLPGEIRNQIYHHLLDGRLIHIYSTTPRVYRRVVVKDHWSVHHVEIERTVNPLAAVCRQLNQETALLPFEWNVWSFQNIDVMWSFLKRRNTWSSEQRISVCTLKLNWLDYYLEGTPANMPVKVKRMIEDLLGGVKRVMTTLHDDLKI